MGQDRIDVQGVEYTLRSFAWHTAGDVKQVNEVDWYGAR